MRLWTVHPKHLDPAGLVAVWREGLLAQAVLLGKTRGYRHHPQLLRFQRLVNPPAWIAAYLDALLEEAARRGYHFNRAKITLRPHGATGRIRVTRGQLSFEWRHLGRKLERRNRTWLKDHHVGTTPTAHPLFQVVPGKVEPWERNDPATEERPGWS